MGEINNEKIYEELLNINKSIGRLEGKVDEQGGHILSVSKKADAVRSELGAHLKDEDAHPGAERRRSSDWRSVLALVLSALGFGLAVKKHGP